MKLRKIIDDTLKNRDGRWSRKSLTAFAAFLIAVGYETILPFFALPTKEYVFITLVTLVGSVLGLTVWDKNKGTEEL